MSRQQEILDALEVRVLEIVKSGQQVPPELWKQYTQLARIVQQAQKKPAPQRQHKPHEKAVDHGVVF